MTHHLASLPWPWLVLMGAVAAFSAPEFVRWVRHEISIYRRARALDQDRRRRSSLDEMTATSTGGRTPAPTISSAGAPLPVSAEDYFDRHPGSRRA